MHACKIGLPFKAQQTRSATDKFHAMRILTSYKCCKRLECAGLGCTLAACSKLMTSWKKEPPGEGMCSKLSHSCLLAAKDCRRQASSTAAPATLPIPPCRASHLTLCTEHLHNVLGGALQGKGAISLEAFTAAALLPRIADTTQAPLSPLHARLQSCKSLVDQQRVGARACTMQQHDHKSGTPNFCIRRVSQLPLATTWPWSHSHTSRRVQTQYHDFRTQDFAEVASAPVAQHSMSDRQYRCS